MPQINSTMNWHLYKEPQCQPVQQACEDNISLSISARGAEKTNVAIKQKPNTEAECN